MSTSALRQPYSSWIVALDRQLLRSKHVILHGNVADQALYSGRSRSDTEGADAQAICCMNFDQVLHRYLVDAGFSLVLQFDAADGLQLASPEMRPQFDKAMTAAIDSNSEQANFGSHLGTPVNVANSIATIRGVLSQDQVTTAIVVHYSDRLFGDDEHLSPEELSLLVQLSKAVETAAFAGSQSRLRNTLICVARELTAVPSWVHAKNPRFVLVPVEKPSASERREWLRTRQIEFYNADGVHQEAIAMIDKLADFTEGMSLFDVSLLPRVSHAEEIELDSHQDIVRAARYGRKQDRWRELGAEKLEDAEVTLRSNVMGQDHAISHVVSSLYDAVGGIRISGGRASGGPPRGVFLLVGPTGVGKTELAKALARYLFGDEDRLRQIDMAEYHLEQSAARLVGAAPGYIGYGKGGELVNHVLAEPFSLILFDEIEKAHPSLWDKFLGILEEGRLTDGRGITGYFDQTMLIFTSNIGSDRLFEYMSQLGQDELPSHTEVEEIYRKAVEDYFTIELKRPELLGRFGDNIIAFDMLRPQLVRDISAKALDQLREVAAREYGIDVQFDVEAIASHIALQMKEANNARLGGRRIGKLLIPLVGRPLNRYVVTERLPRGTKLMVGMSETRGDDCITIRRVDTDKTDGEASR